METLAVDLTRETDAGLLVLMAAADAASDIDQAVAENARHVFYRRHYPYVVAVLKTFAANVGTIVVDPDEFANATFAKFFRSIDSFKDESGGDPAKSAAQVRAYLGLAAANLAKDELDRISRQRDGIDLVVLDDAHDDVEEPESIDATRTNPRALAALRTELMKFTREEIDLVMTYANFGVPTKNGRMLPKDVRDALERRTGYERNNIRQRWHRLSGRLKAKLESFVD